MEKKEHGGARACGSGSELSPQHLTLVPMTFASLSSSSASPSSCSWLGMVLSWGGQGIRGQQGLSPGGQGSARTVPCCPHGPRHLLAVVSQVGEAGGIAEGAEQVGLLGAQQHDRRQRQVRLGESCADLGRVL